MDEFLEMAREVIPESHFQPAPETFLRTLVADVLKGYGTGHTYEDLKTLWAATQAWISYNICSEATPALNAETNRDAHALLDSVLRVCPSRRFFITTDNGSALGPDQMQLGDRVLIIQGAHIPSVIREHEGEPGIYRMLGPAYVRGLMKGQVPNMIAASEMQWEVFEVA